jgi:hypothetical protein
MPEREPTTSTNLDRYGDDILPWSRPRAALAAGGGADITWFLGTVRPDGRPHAAGVGGVWHDGDVYFTSSPVTAKSRHLAADPRATISVRLEGIDVVLEGEVERVTDPPTLDALVALFQAGGWPAEVDTEAHAFTAPFSAPSAGPPPWYLYRLRFTKALGVATAEPYGATRWEFDAGA